MSITDDNYTKALETVNYINNISEGFSKTAGAPGDLNRRVINQSNVIIQLLVDLHQKISELKAEFKSFKNQKDQEPSSSSSVSDDLIKRLEALSLGDKRVKPVLKKGTFYAYKDPYVILEEEKAKLPKK